MANTAHRPRKSKAHLSSRSNKSPFTVIAWASLIVTALFLILNFWVGAPGSAGNRDKGSDVFRLKGGWSDVWPKLLGTAVAGTDKYMPSREGEILGKWIPGFGLEVDAWDPRTHDPRLDPNRYGEEVRVKPREKRFYLTAMIVNRIFKEDKMNITFYEIKQWLEYMKYAGVEHVFWYDTAHEPEESQERNFRPYVKKGFVTYHRFHLMYPGNLDSGYHFEQDQSELHCLNEYGGSTKWLINVDVDEYVFSPTDQTPGFIERLLRLYEGSFPDVTQVLLQCMLFQGSPQLPLPALLIERYQRRKHETEGVALSERAMMKAIVQPASCLRVYKNDPHHFEMRRGRTVAVAEQVMRINHYQGGRASDFQADTPELLSSLEADSSVQPIVDELRRILHVRKRRISRSMGGSTALSRRLS
eukprot:TRINITY_DN26489_c0_g1_i1.p1 TRINITY_DN26489_c0_g1~~TRINITY_DN26489_c0_g1_i1.p1  ORF type:complete len:425 (+),score=32.03 TRINITY_DN26489_c0_g1_i1:31-1275(+)